jgi:clan AA aspartic protease
MVITGVVRGDRMLLPVTFFVDGQPGITIQFVVDTGFTEYLSLPVEAVRSLKLPLIYDMKAGLADGSTRIVDIYNAMILWNGIERVVPVLALGNRALLGVGLLKGYEFCAQVIEGGTVRLEPALLQEKT